MFEDNLLTIKEASKWATGYVGRNITPSNMSYLIQYGKIKKINGNGIVKISQRDLFDYYQIFNGSREISFKK